MSQELNRFDHLLTECQLGDFLSSEKGPVLRFTPKAADIDSFIETLVVLSGKRINLEQSQIPPYFWPATGKWSMRDLHKTYFDDMSYNSGHGNAYDFYGVDAKKGALFIVRPDQCQLSILHVERVC